MTYLLIYYEKMIICVFGTKITYIRAADVTHKHKPNLIIFIQETINVLHSRKMNFDESLLEQSISNKKRKIICVTLLFITLGKKLCKQ